MNRTASIGLWLVAAMQAFGAASAGAQTRLENTDISKESQNPVSRIATLPLRYKAEFAYGAQKEAKDVYELSHALVPVHVNEDWSVITRTQLALTSQPPKGETGQRTFGLENGYTEFFLSPEHGDDFFWGAGPLLYHPSSDSALGPQKWGTGPTLAFVKLDKSPWVYGGVIQNVWTVGPSGAAGGDTNSLMMNPFFHYNFDDGWSVGSSPTINANWLAAADKQWTVPLGGGLSKTSRAGQQPLKVALESYYNIVRPTAGQQTWLMQATVTLLFAD